MLLGALLGCALPRPAMALDFVHEVAPVLRERCGECHLGEKRKGGLSMNTRESLLAGGEHGAVVVPGDAAGSKLLTLVTTDDEDDRMPPKGDPLDAQQVARIREWIQGGLAWEPAFAFKRPAYEPPLRPRRPTVPPPSARDRTHPIDCFLDQYLAAGKTRRPAVVADAAFLRRASLDLVGLLPTPERLAAFLKDRAPDKRDRVVAELLADETAYAEHWLTFWNDLLRNDYAGTGFIDDGRKQITGWLYRALVTNQPYDAFARELIAPSSPESEGFSRGIKWRGQVSAGQSVPVQFAQSVGQSFLGINLKCASCHDSFVDRWKLSDAYGLAAVYSREPLEMYRCDKPTGRTAAPAWLFPELGTIDAAQPPPERLRRLAALMTQPENGRFTRAIVNRIWQRLMGRGLVHPVDAMQGEPWHADLLDHLAARLADDGYDLKKLMACICASKAYQSQAEVIRDDGGAAPYRYVGPRARRLTAEQFVDAVWQLTGTAPRSFDARIGTRGPAAAPAAEPAARWIWTDAGAMPAAGARASFRTTFDLAAPPTSAWAIVTADNGYTFYVNGALAQAGTEWTSPDRVSLSGRLRKGANEFVVVATNGGSGPNPAALWLEARIHDATGGLRVIASDAGWQWSSSVPDAKGSFARSVTNWLPAVVLPGQGAWQSGESALRAALADAGGARMVRASLMKCDMLQRALGRPNREQIVSMRPSDLTTLEAMDLNNGRLLDGWLAAGAQRMLPEAAADRDEFVRGLYRHALSREPTRRERSLAKDALGDAPTAARVQDLLWALLMLPEFQLVR